MIFNRQYMPIISLKRLDLVVTMFVLKPNPTKSKPD